MQQEETITMQADGKVEVKQGMEDVNETIIDADVKEAIKNEINTVPYKPMSTLPSLGTVIPISFLSETIEAQSKILSTINNVDEFLMKKLKYRSKVALSEAFAAEQADAIAMAIYQIENGESLILADQAGTGKGRVCAGILRYAFVNDYLPIFITEKDNLFTDIYRDIIDIGGIGAIKREKKYYGNPLILNGYKSGGKEKDEEGKTIKKPSPTSILNDDGDELIVAPEIDTINELMKTGILPKDYDFILLTYSQLSAPKSGKKKYDYLIEAAKQRGNGKYIFVMDECHNASGSKSATGEKTRGLVLQSSGCLFSSATYSKTPENMYMYSFKNDMRKANVPIEELLDIIKKGGERLIENMAANLAQAGQLLRRERRFDNCTVEYKFMEQRDKESLFEKYDKTLGIYRELLSYFNLGNMPFFSARKKAIERFAKKKKLELCTEPMPTKKDAKGKALDDLIAEWEKRNKGTYVIKRYTAGEINRTQFNFIETLLFALKSEFVTNIALSQLYGNAKYPEKGENWSLENKRVDDKSVFKSNRKPVIAVRNTLEGIYNTLGLKVGDYLEDNDFIIYIKAIIQTALNGVLVLKEIRPDDKVVEVSDEHPIELSDFEDKGERYLKFIEDIKDVKLNIPVSPIDYLIDEIESKLRDAQKDSYGGGSATFVVGEVTGRTKRLQKQEDGRYLLIENKRDKNKANVFKKFNNGIYDVLLINESGSTGASAHSSIKFADQRPRVMIIHQVELDVNQEVQKRGRINRTGMVNYPTYIYAISRIPSEIRRLLMLAKKLRKLDANTTGNQKQSQALSQIRDSENNPIEDVVNRYGDEVLEEFLSDPNNEPYLQYRLTKGEKGRAILSDTFEIESFMRRLELALAKDQETFYNTINILYKQKLIEKKEEKINDIETELIDLKAAIINRVVKKQGDNTSPFNTSVYLEDNKALSQDVPLEKTEVDELMNKLAMGKKPEAFISELIDDFKKEQKKVIEEELDAIEKPDFKGKSKDEKKELETEYAEKLESKKARLEAEENRILTYLQYFTPNKPCQIPAIEEECYEPDEDGKINITEWNSARFVGIVISKAAKHKYSPMNIEFVFCQLSGKPKYKVKPTAKGSVILDIIMNKVVSITALQQIGLWQVDKNLRRFLKLVTGNLIQGYDVAKTILQTEPDDYSRNFDFIKFTTVDNLAIRYGIRLHMKPPYKKINVQSHRILYSINQEAFIKKLLDPKEKDVIGANAAITTYVKITETHAYIMFFGGIHKFRGGADDTEPTEKKKKYFSRFYTDPQIKDIANKYGVPVDDYYDSYKLSSGAVKYLNRLKLGIAKDNPKAKDFLSELTNYVASIIQINIELKNVTDDETIKDQIDPYDAMYQDGEKKEEKEGEYIYEFLAPPDASLDNITADSKFIKYVKKEDGGGRYGSAYFRFRPKVSDAIAYSMMPVSPKPNEMIADTLSVLSDDDVIKMKIELEKAVKDGKTDDELGRIVMNYIKTRVFARKVIFGNYSNAQDIGLIFRNFVIGKETELPEEPKRDEAEPEEKEKIELNMDTAQEFIILLSSKIN